MELIGKKIRKIRKSKKITLAELSEMTGIQIATLSRIETNKMPGTLKSHMQIANALGIDFVDLYKDSIPSSAQDASPLAAENEQAETFSFNENASYEILTSHLFAKKMMPIILKIEPNGTTNTEHNAPGSERFIFILEGSLTVKTQDKTYILEKNASLYMNAAQPHSFANTGKETVLALSVTTPVAL